MNLKSKYKYNSKNLFIKQESYRYSSFVGKSLINSFLNDRKDYIKKLEVKHKQNCFILAHDKKKYNFLEFLKKKIFKYICK